MSHSELHEAVFTWPRDDGASSVIVTGDFDQWSLSLHLTKTSDGHFTGATRIPWNQKIAYKFVVDGRWMTGQDSTEMDSSGNVNNVYTAPAQPFSPVLVAPVAEPIVLASSPTAVSETAPSDPSLVASLPTQLEAAQAVPAQVGAVAVAAVEKAKEVAPSQQSETVVPVDNALPTKATLVETAQTLPSPVQAPVATVIEKAKDVSPSQEAVAQAIAPVVPALPTKETIMDTAQATLAQTQAVAAGVVEKAKALAPSEDTLSHATSKALDATDEPPLLAGTSATSGELENKPSVTTSGFQLAVSDIVDTIAARHGIDEGADNTTLSGVASAGVAYVSSALGIIIKNTVGVDPINPAQTAIVDDTDAVPREIVEESASKTLDVPATKPMEIAPIVPIGILAVNDASNNDVERTPAQISTEEVPAVATLPTEDATVKEGTSMKKKQTTTPLPAHVTNGASPAAETLPTEPMKDVVAVSALEKPTETSAVEASSTPVAPPPALAASESTSTSKFVEVESAVTTPVTENGPATNGVLPKVPATTTPAPSAPSTPAGTPRKMFPSASTPDKSPSRFGSTRLKRNSIFGKISQIFGKDDEKKEKKKEKK